MKIGTEELLDARDRAHLLSTVLARWVQLESWCALVSVCLILRILLGHQLNFCASPISDGTKKGITKNTSMRIAAVIVRLPHQISKLGDHHSIFLQYSLTFLSASISSYIVSPSML